MFIYVLPCVLIVVLALVFTVFVINKNKFQSLIIKIKEAENNIDDLLKKKYNLLCDIGKLIKQKTKENPFEDLNLLNTEDFSYVEVNDMLAKYDHTVREFADYNRNIKFSKGELGLFEDFSNVNIECLAAEKYYNDNVNIYNKLIGSFPASIIASVKRYKEKKLFSNEKEEIFEILKQ